jgi:ATP-dependent RNA helicase DDX19/DBP5
MVESSSSSIILTTEEGETTYASSKQWTDLEIKPSIRANLETAGWAFPTLIQGVAIPIILSSRNLVAQSKNGTGKTGAFTIGALEGIDTDVHALQVVVISHTRELNKQNYRVFTELARGTGILVEIGQKETRELPHCHVLCGTHGALARLLRGQQLSQVKSLIYDEADFLFESSENLNIVRQLQSMMPAAQQLLFSATYTPQVRTYIADSIREYSEIRIEKEEDLNLTNVEQFVIRCEHTQKHKTVADILKSVDMKCCLIFVNTKSYGASLLDYLKEKGYTASIIGTGLVTDEVRDEIIEKMRRGEIKVLITSNVLSRGFDLKSVSLVVNLDIPMMMVRRGVFEPDPTTYLHRIGRTGRYGRRGVAVNVVADGESRDALVKIQRHFQSEINSVTIEGLAEAMVRVNVDYD